MTNGIDKNHTTIDEWRELGFYYDLNEDNDIKEWRFFGSREGILSFTSFLNEYANRVDKETISEHDHLGPYNYLKIMTWDKAIITDQYFAGTIRDIKTLGNLIGEKLNNTKAGGAFSIDHDYGTGNTATAKFFVMADTFDPASMDDLLVRVKYFLCLGTVSLFLKSGLLLNSLSPYQFFAYPVPLLPGFALLQRCRFHTLSFL